MVDDIHFTLTAKTPAVIAGESLPLEDTLTNLGDAPAEVGGHPSLPAYRLQPVDELLPAQTRSPAALLALVMADARMPPAQAETQALAAGASIDSRGDPAAYGDEALPPGDYRITVRRQVDGNELESNEVRVRIERPDIGRLTSFFCPLSGQQVQAFDHRDEDGRPSAFLRDGLGDRAELGAFLRLGPIAGRGDVQGIAASVHIADSIVGRWVVTLRGGTVSAWHAWGSSLTARPLPLLLDLEEAVLVETGFHVASAVRSHPAYDFGDGLFVVAGRRRVAGEADTSVVQRLRVTAQAIVPVGGPLPFGEAGEPLPARILACGERGSLDVDLVWSDASSAGGSTRIRSRGFSFAAEAPSAPSAASTVLHESPLSLLALERVAVDTPDAPASVQALFGPAPGADRHDVLVHVRMALQPDGHPTVERQELAAPDAEVTQGAVSCGLAAGEVVLAQSRGRIWQTALPNGGGWRLLRDQPEPWRQLRVAASPEGYWGALGIDAERGVACIRDPDYSRE